MIRVEFAKQTLRLRTYLLLGLMIVIPVIMTVALKVGGPPSDHRHGDFLNLVTDSGLDMPLAALGAMSGMFLLPLVVLVFAGGAIAEEASWGSLRYLLLRPVSRGRLLLSKLAVAAVLALVATLLITLSALVAGVIAFGWHPAVTLSSATLPQNEALPRLVAATLYVAWSLSGVIAFGLMLSTMTDAALGAVSGGIGLTIVSEILDSIPALGGLRDVFPTHYWRAWEGLFSQPAVTGDIVHGALLQIPYVVLFLAAAWWWFHRKDIVS
jgi:ABC-2 type transport system permease protein